MKKHRAQPDQGLAGGQPAASLDLLPENPGAGLLSAEAWVRLADRLQLTARELSVAVLLFEGKTRLQIARKLQCASGTVRVYIDRLFVKLNVQDRLGMALGIVRLHLALLPAPPRSRRTKMRLDSPNVLVKLR